MKTHHRLSVLILHPVAVVLLLATGAQASPVTTWRTFKAPATIIQSGQGTDDPVIGSTTTTSSASRIIGYFSSQTLTSVGDKISLTFKVSFNDGGGVANGGDNFRFALFDVNGEAVPVSENIATAGSTDTNGFLGYWAGVKTGSGAGAAGSLRERFDTTNIDMFANASASANLAATPITGTNITFAGSVNGVGTAPIYTGEMTIARTATGIDLSGSFIGNGGSNAFSVSETTPISLTYGAVGFLNATGISADQVIFQDVTVTFVPEAASVAMLGLVSGVSALAAVWRRRGRA